MSNPLSTYLVPGAVAFGSTASSSDEVIGLLADHLETAGVVHPSYRAAVIARRGADAHRAAARGRLRPWRCRTPTPST